MSFAWLFRFAERTHPLALPALYVGAGGLIYGALLWATEGGWVRQGLAHRHLIGTLLLFVLLPAYLIAMLPRQRSRTQQALEALQGIARAPDVAAVRERLDRMPPVGWLGLALGLLLGLAQNPFFFEQIGGPTPLHPVDAAFVGGACLLWIVVGLALGWRLPISAALSKLGGNLPLDLYRLDELRPLARVATTDILAVAGAMALTPLQSLDAEFRLGNYSWAIAVGVSAAVLLFVVPLWGVHKNIRSAKQERLRVLRGMISEVDRGDIARLETLTSHLERVRSIPNWPVDLELVTRLIGYVIIPPLAWVAAALVENLIDRF